MDSGREAYDELYCDAMGREGFVLQHVVDAFAAQTADEQTKPIALAFALIGLCLRVEKQFDGRVIQQIHMQLAKRSKVWPKIPFPAERGNVSAADVLLFSAGAERDRAIDDWCRSVWDAFRDSHETVYSLLRQYEIG